MKPIILPSNFNYIGAFLTLACNLSCHFCINTLTNESTRGRKLLTPAQWIEGLNRIESRDIPITLCGGEPTTRKGWQDIINGVDNKFDILTNLQFDVDEFIKKVPIKKVTRDAPYAMIRVSYHPTEMELAPLLEKVKTLQRAGYSIGVWGVMHPLQANEILDAQRVACTIGIDFRTKEFLGEYDGKFYGTLKYKDACNFTNKNEQISAPILKKVDCKTSELLIGPSGFIYPCHTFLYEKLEPIGHILDPDFEIIDDFRPCSYFGRCSPCDIKVTTNRFQESGHTSVEILK